VDAPTNAIRPPGSTAGASNDGPARPSGITAAIRGTPGSITSIAPSVRTFAAPVPLPIAPVAVTSTSSRPPGDTTRATPVGLKYGWVNSTGVAGSGRTRSAPPLSSHS